MQLAPLNVEVSTNLDGTNIYTSRVGRQGVSYDLSFVAMLRLISLRCGAERKSLEYRK